MLNGEGFTFGNLDDWRTDPAKCRDGVPFEMGKGRALIVRRANLFDREIQAHFKNVDWQDSAAVQEVFARTLVVDWRGITDSDGDPVPFSAAACLALFKHANELWEELQRFALNRANYAYQAAQEDEAAVKTSRAGATAQAPTAHN